MVSAVDDDQGGVGDRGGETRRVRGIGFIERADDDGRGTFDVAESVIFFLSDRASMITGQRLLVNAGEYFDT